MKKYKRFYVLLFAIILLAFLFIFRNLASTNSTCKEVTNEINALYFFNSLLIISISILYYISIRLKTKEIQVNQSITNNNSPENSNIAELTKERNEMYEKKIIEILSQLKNVLSLEKTQEKMLEAFLKIIVKQTDSIQAALFLTLEKEDKKMLRFVSGYAFYVPENESIEFHFGEGLSGQVAIDKKMLNLSDINIDRIPVYSGMGSSVPQNLLICPLIKNKETIGVLELASFRKYQLPDEQFIEQAILLLNDFLNPKS